MDNRVVSRATLSARCRSQPVVAIENDCRFATKAGEAGLSDLYVGCRHDRY